MSDTGPQLAMDTLAQNFRNFAEVDCQAASALYEFLSMSIASDQDILRLAAEVPPGQPVPNLLFGVVHYLLYQQPDPELARYYPSMANSPQPAHEAFPYFRQFCLARQTAIVDLLHTRRVQTNEVRRCACLYPAFSQIFEPGPNMPLSLIEIGTSAGLNLMWDYYQYDYGSGTVVGRPNASVTIHSAFRGDKRPRLLAAPPAVQERIGIDLNLIDARKPEDTLWLKALIWPEQRDRAALLTSALQVVQTHPPTLLAGDGILLLPQVLDRLRSDTAACIYHTYTLNQISAEDRLQLRKILTDFSKQRPIYQIGCERFGTEYPQLTLSLYQGGQSTETLLAYCDWHGRWIEWVDFIA